jgi:hypothetical protein
MSTTTDKGELKMRTYEEFVSTTDAGLQALRAAWEQAHGRKMPEHEFQAWRAVTLLVASLAGYEVYVERESEAADQEVSND